MLPPLWTVLPAAERNSEMRVVVVVFPSEPVTAYFLQGQREKNTSISLVTALPSLRSSQRVGFHQFIPGVRKTTSASMSSR